MKTCLVKLRCFVLALVPGTVFPLLAQMPDEFGPPPDCDQQLNAEERKAARRRARAGKSPAVRLGALKFLALENALIDNDGYRARVSDYRLYSDVKAKFHDASHDMNETFGRPGELVDITLLPEVD